jgi:hypothetical protein
LVCRPITFRLGTFSEDPFEDREEYDMSKIEEEARRGKEAAQPEETADVTQAEGAEATNDT